MLVAALLDHDISTLVEVGGSLGVAGHVVHLNNKAEQIRVSATLPAASTLYHTCKIAGPPGVSLQDRDKLTSRTCYYQ